MTLQLLHSEFPYIWGKFDYLFYQCTMLCPTGAKLSNFINSVHRKKHYDTTLLCQNIFFKCVNQRCFICRPQNILCRWMLGSNPGLWQWHQDALTTRLKIIHVGQISSCQNIDQNSGLPDHLNCKTSYQSQLVVTWFCFYSKMWIWLPAWWLDWPGWQHDSHSARGPVHKSYIYHMYVFTVRAKYLLTASSPLL